MLCKTHYVKSNVTDMLIFSNASNEMKVKISRWDFHGGSVAKTLNSPVQGSWGSIHPYGRELDLKCCS